MQQPGRKFSAGSSYRYGFNGQEINNEISQHGNSYITEFRQYEVRIGRWLSIDPLIKKYPGLSPYVAFNAKPILQTQRA